MSLFRFFFPICGVIFFAACTTALPVDDAGDETTLTVKRDAVASLLEIEANAVHEHEQTTARRANCRLPPDPVQLKYIVQSVGNHDLCMNPQTNGQPVRGSIVQWYNKCEAKDDTLVVQEVPYGDGSFYLKSPWNDYCMRPSWDGRLSLRPESRLEWHPGCCAEDDAGGSVRFTKQPMGTSNDGSPRWRLVHKKTGMCAVPKHANNQQDFALYPITSPTCTGSRGLLQALKGSLQFKEAPDACKNPQSPTGYWKWLSPCNTKECHYTEEDSLERTDTRERSEGWEKAVETSISTSLTFGACAGICSGVQSTTTFGLTNTETKSIQNTVSKALSRTKTTSRTIIEDRRGSLWKFEISVKDSCGDNKITDSSWVVFSTGGTDRVPCCLPGEWLDSNYVHGPCRNRAKCTCSKEVCDGTAPGTRATRAPTRSPTRKTCPHYCRQSKEDVFKLCNSAGCMGCDFCQEGYTPPATPPSRPPPTSRPRPPPTSRPSRRPHTHRPKPSKPKGACASWCGRDKRPWSQKCTWGKYCGGCGSCSAAKPKPTPKPAPKLTPRPHAHRRPHTHRPKPSKPKGCSSLCEFASESQCKDKNYNGLWGDRSTGAGKGYCTWVHTTCITTHCIGAAKPKPTPKPAPKLTPRPHAHRRPHTHRPKPSKPKGACASWCGPDKRPWSQKCTWGKYCGGCDSCSGCTDTAGWGNGYRGANGGKGFSCADYTAKGWCKDGAGQKWTLGSNFKYPEQNCCACGKQAAKI